MGRELKRVPLDFEWPLNKAWQGFINPHHVATQCAYCGGTGSSPGARHLKDKWYGNAPFHPEDRGSTPFLPTHPAVRAFAERNVAHAPEYYGSGEAAIQREARRLADHFNRGWSHHLNSDDVAALLAEQRLMDLTHEFVPGDGWKPKEPAYTPTPEEVNEWSIRSFGHDSINQWIVVDTECKRLGVPSMCDHCHGEGEIWPSDEAKALYEAWERSEPAAGDGYQIWETVSEGSPISPVFATPEELARYMAGRPWGGDPGSSYESWMSFINGPGWEPSMVIADGVIHTGPDAI